MKLTPRPFLARFLPLVLLLATVSVVRGCGGDSEPAEPWRTQDDFVRAMNRGVHLMDQYDYAGAGEALAKAVELEPKSVEARLALAIATFNIQQEGNVERATAMLDDILAEDPNQLSALYFRGLLYMDNGLPEKAIGLLEKVVAQVPHDGHAWYVLGRAQKHADLPAKEALLRAIEETPMLASAYYDLFLTEARDGNEEKALEYQERFLALRESPLADKLEIPQYRQMGRLAMVRPLSALPDMLTGGATLTFGAPREILLGREGVHLGLGSPEGLISDVEIRFGAVQAVADVDEDGDLDLLTVAHSDDSRGEHTIVLLRNDGAGNFAEAPAATGLGGTGGIYGLAFGDYDNDGHVDLFVSRHGPNQLFHGLGNGEFTDVTESTGTAGGEDNGSAQAVFVDIDHDADLDIYVCNHDAREERLAANQLLRNNADGTFTDVAPELGLACADMDSVMIAPVDMDDDRDTDLLVFHMGSPVSYFENRLLDGFAAAEICATPLAGDGGGVAQDFNGDGKADLLLHATATAPQRLYFNRGAGELERSAQFDSCVPPATPGKGLPTRSRVADVDLDGDLDVLVGDYTDAYFLLNDGWGKFVRRAVAVPPEFRAWPWGIVLCDLTGDGIVDLVSAEDPVLEPEERPGRLVLHPGALTPPPNRLALTVSGERKTEPNMRSAKSGYGTKVEVRAGLHAQTLTQTGLYGGLGQSLRPLVFGLDGAPQADYVALRWADGVTQSESGLAANEHHTIRELERRRSSCPVLFTWNGERFVFVGDFAGVGGLGYYSGPGGPAPPQPRELVRIDPADLVARDGLLELRVTEPMEEVAYFDRLELLAVDHPAGTTIWPDERLVVTGAPASQELLCVGREVYPVRAQGPDGDVPAANLRATDRHYAYAPAPDPRFVGYCVPHSLVLEFGDEVAAFDPARPTHLYIGSSLEYPYSQTNVGAGQSDTAWEPPRVELRGDDGTWTTLVADAGAPAGMARTIAVDLTGLLPRAACTLRLTTNLELYFDRVFLAQDLGREDVGVQAVPMARADLHRLGFPQEYSPDGHHPRIYSYDIIEPTSSFRRLPGAYTRYGDVSELLATFDDRLVLMATGDEIALAFDASALPPPAESRTRTFVLLSHAYCKDMDLYTGHPDSVEPLPFAAMTGYPYAEGESYPNTDALRAKRAEFDTRIVR